MKRRRWMTGCALMACSAPMPLFAAATPEPATQFLPLFPLNLVAFPGEIVLLHVFEPRYKQLIGESADSGITFGIVTVVPGGASSVGTEMRLDRILKIRDSGNMDVAVRGVRVFQLKRFQHSVDGKLYSGGHVSFGGNDPRTDPEIQNALVELYNRMQQRAGSRRIIAAPYPENLSFHIGHEVGLSQAQELQLLTMRVEQDRQMYIFQHLVQSQ